MIARTMIIFTHLAGLREITVHQDFFPAQFLQRDSAEINLSFAIENQEQSERNRRLLFQSENL